MNKHRLLFGLAFVLGSLGLTACYEEPDFALTPAITFRDIEQRTLRNPQNVVYDSLILVVRFQDGDGNLGLSETLFSEDKDPPFNSGGPNFFNILVNLYKKVNGVFQPVRDPFGKIIDYNGRFPRVSTEAREEPLEGDIRYSINIFSSSSPNSPIKKGDTIRFDARIFDRSLNQSNMVTSSEVILFSNE